jgi:hypothetical protein
LAGEGRKDHDDKALQDLQVQHLRALMLPVWNIVAGFFAVPPVVE